MNKKLSLKNNDVLSLDQFDKNLINVVLQKAKKYKKGIYSSRELSKKMIALLFVEPSTRTFSSFAAAAKKLGAQTLEFQNPLQTSSMVKGETLEDSVRTLQCYSDLIVLRHPEKGSAKRAADALEIPLVNAGDGVGEHPSQALLDMFTIQENVGKLDHLKGLIAGDLLNGRTVHSFIRGLSFYKNTELFLLSPKQLTLTKEDFSEFVSRGVKLTEIQTEKDIPHDCQFWYWTRVQKERFSDIKEYEKVKNSFTITPKLLHERAHKNTIIMHPFPRVGEIEFTVDNDKRAKYFEQMKNGLYIRMALLSEIL